MSGVPHFYIFSKEKKEVEIKPAVLFELDWQQIPKDWHIRINKDTYELEILPKEFAEIENWFEKYIDEDEEVVKFTHNIIGLNNL